jgi:2-hydroxymuconate-semialdehyde hydrolase
MTTATTSSYDVAVGDFSIRVNESGDRTHPTIVFLHGSGPGATGMSNWERAITTLGDQFHCVAPDILGFGDSSHPDPAPAGMAAFAELRVDATIGLLDAMKIDKAHFVGNSMGGMFTLLLAGRAPERVDKMLLMGSGGAPVASGPDIVKLVRFYDEPTAEKMAEMMTAFVYDPSMFGDQLQAIAAARMPMASRPDVRRSHLATFNFKAGPSVKFDADYLAKITHKTLCIHGADDTIVSPENSDYFREHLPNAEQVVIRGCGHWTQIEHPDTFAHLARQFFTS